GDALPEGAVVRLGTTRFRHPYRVSTVAVSRDGKLLASGSFGNTLRVWEASTGREILAKQTMVVLYGLNTVAFMPDGQRLALSDGRGVSVVRVADGNEERRVGGAEREWVTSLAVSPDGETIAIARENGAISLYATTSGKLIRALPKHDKRVEQLAFNREGTLVVSAGNDEMLRAWDSKSGRMVLAKSARGAIRLHAMAISPAQDLVAYAVREEVIVIEIPSGMQRFTLPVRV